MSFIGWLPNIYSPSFSVEGACGYGSCQNGTCPDAGSLKKGKCQKLGACFYNGRTE